MSEPLSGGNVHLVSDLDTLGVAGGAGGVDEHGDVKGGDPGQVTDGFRGGQLLGEGVPSGRAGGIHVRRGVGHEEPGPDAGGELGGFFGHVDERGVGDEPGGFGVVEDVGRFVALVGGVDGDGDGADGGQSEPAVEELGAVGQEEADPVAGVDAQTTEHSGGAEGPFLELAVGDAVSGDFDEGLVGLAPDGQLHEFAQGPLPGMASGRGFQSDYSGHNSTAAA